MESDLVLLDHQETYKETYLESLLIYLVIAILKIIRNLFSSRHSSLETKRAGVSQLSVSDKGWLMIK